jgi:RNA polymerase sigma-70 factor, ECF subfamily
MGHLLRNHTSQAAALAAIGRKGGGTPVELDSERLSRLRSGLWILALRALGDRDAAEDAVQETLARALAALRGGHLEDPTKLGAFVRGIARHVIADALRSRRRITSIDPIAEGVPDAGADDPLHLLVNEEERECVRSALAHLSEQDREILSLAFFDGLTPTEIAERLSVSSEVIRKRKSRALARLRQAYLRVTETGHGPGSTPTYRQELD